MLLGDPSMRSSDGMRSVDMMASQDAYGLPTEDKGSQDSGNGFVDEDEDLESKNPFAKCFKKNDLEMIDGVRESKKQRAARLRKIRLEEVLRIKLMLEYRVRFDMDFANAGEVVLLIPAPEADRHALVLERHFEEQSSPKGNAKGREVDEELMKDFVQGGKKRGGGLEEEAFSLKSLFRRGGKRKDTFMELAEEEAMKPQKTGEGPVKIVAKAVDATETEMIELFELGYRGIFYRLSAPSRGG
jgi:hypothetical protein